MAATDILGKIGEKVGTQISTISSNLSDNYATKVSLGTTNANVTANASAITALDTAKASKVSLANYADGSSVFSLIKGTRAELGELKVTGQMTVIDTQTIEVSDNILELNKADQGAETAQVSGIAINRGIDTSDPADPQTRDKAQILWDDGTSTFKLNLGTAAANLTADTVTASVTGNVSGNLTGSVDASANGETVKVHGGASLLLNNVALGDYSTFETAFTAAIGS